MNKKSFFLGALVGVVVGVLFTFITLYIVGTVFQNSAEEDPIQYLEKPISYENKKETSFKVLQVLSDNAALAKEVSDKDSFDGKEYVSYLGNTVVIIGKNFYSEQEVTVKNPQRIGTYSYTNNGGMPMTVPVINGNMQ